MADARPSPSRQLARAALARLLPPRLFLVRGQARSRTVFLTFDDGPHPEHTPRLLDVLRDLAVPATFFVIGERAERSRDIVRRMVADGHAIGHHSWTHAEPRDTSAATLSEEATRGRRFVRDLTGVDSRLFRPPKGELTAAKLVRLWWGGFTVVLWDTDCRDYAARSRDEVTRFFETSGLDGGEIVLLHDTHPFATAALPEIVHRARAQGIEFARISHRSAGSAA